MHPFVSFPSLRRSPSTVATTFVISGDAEARRQARRVARLAGARSLEAPVHGPAYHAAAAFVANGAAALAWSGSAILERLGLSPKAAQTAIAGLLHSVADNVASVGVPDALSGPIARGDAATIRAHRAALKSSERRDYDAVAPIVLRCGQAQGLSPAAASQVRAELRR
jgi:predicted short-subunit dehydrogenase-like oxidoreductase (DUF2520 family)